MCKLCMKTFAILTIGEPASKSYTSNKKHQTALRKRKTRMGNFPVFREPLKHNKYALRKEQGKAEILWPLQSVMSHFPTVLQKILQTFYDSVS